MAAKSFIALVPE